MEEKERYEIHIYDDICVALYDNGVLDKSINDTYKLEELLNQQDKRIKELEEELDDAKRDYIPKLEFGLQRANKMGRDAEKEIQQLKQQLHDLPKKIVEEIRDCLLDVSNGWWRYFMSDGCEYMLSSDLQGCLDEIIDTILKKYGGEDE